MCKAKLAMDGTTFCYWLPVTHRARVTLKRSQYNSSWWNENIYCEDRAVLFYFCYRNDNGTFSWNCWSCEEAIFDGKYEN